MSSISTKIQLLDFEKPLGELKAKLAFLEAGEDSASPAKQKEIKQVTEEIVKKEKEVYSKLTAWKITQIARHPNRPSTLDFIEHMSQDPIFLHGDRFFRDDPSIVAAITKIDGKPFMVVGHQKGKNTLDNMKRNFGMSHPEGYRKALRLMQLADKFSMPILTFIDTPGAFPGIEAEERQQSTAIAQNLQAMGELGVPIISVILGEGGSGGALAIGVANRVLMLENSVYSVISPEGCASILWDDGAKSQVAAEILRLTSHDLYEFGVIEEIIDEPYNCAHNNPLKTLSAIKKAVLEHYLNLKDLSPAALMEQRYKRFRRLGVVHKVTPKA